MKRELKAAIEDTDNQYKQITADDISAAYDWRRAIGVRVLKCVGYDEAFQREIHQKFQS
ncbi:hypothetical protein PILCRDRAFT_822330 [Piloderma croceum F 1598]|uniref:DUF6697 domain-containing protein n=1 Tax=Piloderma croceum (strain F 1598) TaxID=765440 RepID=A0A0C3B332_PILCF|nr:hypothetical protein PILCRDRAFT_822330 [Piloderma croceum F 1598]